jgi:hypothetical protein
MAHSVLVEDDDLTELMSLSELQARVSTILHRVAMMGSTSFSIHDAPG